MCLSVYVYCAVGRVIEVLEQVVRSAFHGVYTRACVCVMCLSVYVMCMCMYNVRACVCIMCACVCVRMCLSVGVYNI